MEIEYKYALVLKLENQPAVVRRTDASSSLLGDLRPIAKSHITLIGGKALKDVKDVMKANAPGLTLDHWPDLEVLYGQTGTATREMPDGEVRETLFVEIANQEDFADMVNEMCEMLGIENPEPERFFHLSLANNHGGNPFKSVGAITADDLRGN